MIKIKRGKNSKGTIENPRKKTLSIPLQKSNNLKALLEIIDLLRDKKKGCAWDLKQTIETLKNPLVEEVFEVAQAIESGDESKISEELGDLLFVTLMMMHIADQDKIIQFSSSVNTIVEKLKRRHPHIFGGLKVSSSDEILKNWEKIKRAEKKNNDTYSVLADIPRSMPALLRINRFFNKLDRLGELSKKNTERNKSQNALQKSINNKNKGNAAEKKYTAALYRLSLSAFKDKVNLEDILHKVIEKEILKRGDLR